MFTTERYTYYDKKRQEHDVIGLSGRSAVVLQRAILEYFPKEPVHKLIAEHEHGAEYVITHYRGLSEANVYHVSHADILPVTFKVNDKYQEAQPPLVVFTDIITGVRASYAPRPSIVHTNFGEEIGFPDLLEVTLLVIMSMLEGMSATNIDNSLTRYHKMARFEGTL